VPGRPSPPLDHRRPTRARIVIGAVLAGGRGRRLRVPAGGKAIATLAGRPLVAYPLDALAPVCDRLAVVCKAETALPRLEGVERWDEPADPRHPLTGLVHALSRARGAVLICAADMPFVTPEACRSLLTAARRSGAAATVAATGGLLQPLLGVYEPGALPRLGEAEAGEPLTRAVERLEPARVAFPERICRSVNSPADLADAEALIAGSGRAPP
jgi:molybdopterin-guanine dinucleotide biosynthesis protein A